MADIVDELRQDAESMLSAAPFPETMPYFSNAVADSHGNLWVREYQPAASTERPRWFVFDPSGVLLGDIATPSGFDVYEIGSAFILGRRTDTLGVEHVEAYSLL